MLYDGYIYDTRSIAVSSLVDMSMRQDPLLQLTTANVLNMSQSSVYPSDSMSKITGKLNTTWPPMSSEERISIVRYAISRIVKTYRQHSAWRAERSDKHSADFMFPVSRLVDPPSQWPGYNLFSAQGCIELVTFYLSSRYN
ncbi:hypothetical protein Btru_062304 [Bulinus truncatus]|nr:hypothetical protein Btru_062304 [Bulinus truncatus]